MAVFNVSFLNPKMRSRDGGLNAGILKDQLTILEQELGKDGYMSPGDYDVLIDKARQIRSNPAFSSSQRSDMDVKISRYENERENVKINKAENIDRMNTDLENEAATDTFMAGNNPSEWLQARVASQQGKLNELQEIIQRRMNAGHDVTEYQNEYAETLTNYQRKLESLSAMETFDGENPVIGYVAYVDTNNQGEIVNVDYTKHGTKSGYVETNGMIDGFQVYGKVNFKRDGTNNFILGDKLFRAPDIMKPDPENPGSFKASRLVADTSRRGPITVGEGGYINMPGTSLSMQSYLPYNSWAKGVSGTIYKRRDDGGYTRYLNATSTEELPDMPETDRMITLPQMFERNIMRNVDETVDIAEPLNQDESEFMTPLDLGQTQSELGGSDFMSGGEAPTPIQAPRNSQTKTTTPATVQQARQQRRTPQQPTEQASQGILPTAKRTIQSGVNYLKGLFR